MYPKANLDILYLSPRAEENSNIVAGFRNSVGKQKNRSCEKNRPEQCSRTNNSLVGNERHLTRIRRTITVRLITAFFFARSARLSP